MLAVVVLSIPNEVQLDALFHVDRVEFSYRLANRLPLTTTVIVCVASGKVYCRCAGHVGLLPLMAFDHEIPQGFQIPAKRSDSKRVLKSAICVDLVITRNAWKVRTLTPCASYSIEEIWAEPNPGYWSAEQLKPNKRTRCYMEA